jgi:molybdopterin-guanine dinucleotide biosynthesis protein A
VNGVAGVSGGAGVNGVAGASGGAGVNGVAGLLLAAGGGRRYGQPKALVVRDGRLAVERALDVLRDGGCDPLAVVLGAAAGEVRARADLAQATAVDNPDWATGMGSSLRVGLAALDAVDAVAALVMLVDTPGVTPGPRSWPGPATTGSPATPSCSAGTTGPQSRRRPPATRAPARTWPGTGYGPSPARTSPTAPTSTRLHDAELGATPRHSSVDVLEYR